MIWVAGKNEGCTLKLQDTVAEVLGVGSLDSASPGYTLLAPLTIVAFENQIFLYTNFRTISLIEG